MRDTGSVPQNTDGRRMLLERVADAEAAGDREEAAARLLDLAALVKQIGPTTEKPWYQEALEYVERAFALLEGSNNKRLLARAYRSACVKFVTPPGKEREYLDTAMRLSTEIGDQEGRGWALLALSALRPRDPHASGMLTSAEDAFVVSGCKRGLAAVFQAQGALGSRKSNREQSELLVRAAGHHLEVGDKQGAGRAFLMAEVFGYPELNLEERIALLSRSASLAKQAGAASDEASCYDKISHIYAEFGDSANSQIYKEKQDALVGGQE